jgi:hypothetical protein
VLDLLWDALDQLLKLLQLCRDDLEQLLKLYELLLLEKLHLLQLLGHDLQQLQNLLWQRRDTDSSVAAYPLIRVRLTVRTLTRIREPQWGDVCRCSDSERGSCYLTHLTSSVMVLVGPRRGRRTAVICLEIVVAFT